MDIARAAVNPFGQELPGKPEACAGRQRNQGLAIDSWDAAFWLAA